MGIGEKMAAEVTFGEIDWNSGDDSGSGSRTEFMKLEQGESTVRIMGNPLQYYIHWLDTPDGKKRKVNSPIGSPELVRKLEDAGFKRRPRWIVKVLDRSDEQFKVLEIGSQIYSAIKALYNNKKWGKVTGYDITIERGAPGSQPLYRVTPDPKEPLDERFRDQFLKFNDSLNLDKLIQPTDPSQVCEYMGWSETGPSSGTSSNDMMASDEDDSDGLFDFKS